MKKSTLQVNNGKYTETGSTTNYGSFKKVFNNRELKTTTKKFKDLKEDIKNKGYLISPIVVTPLGSVVDGQHRIAICKELGISVEYVVNYNAKEEDIKSANGNRQDWTTLNWITTHADSDIVDYILLLDMLESYKDFPQSAILDAFSQGSSKGKKDIINGEYEICLESGRKLLDSARKLAEVLRSDYKKYKFIQPFKSLMNSNPNFSLRRFAEKLTQRKLHLYSASSDTRELMVDIYNSGLQIQEKKVS